MRNIAVAVLLSVSLAPGAPCASQTGQVGNLEGIDSIAIAIHISSASSGLTRLGLQREVQTALERAGITVVEDGPPYLHLSVWAPSRRSTRGSLGLWVDSVPITGSEFLNLRIWEESARGDWESGYEVRDEIMGLVAVFVRQYRLQNPPRQPQRWESRNWQCPQPPRLHPPP